MSKADSTRGEQLLSLRRLQIPEVFIDGANVSSVASKSVLRCIDDHGAICWAGIETIARETGYCERTVRRACKALESLSLVTAESRIGRTSIFKINWSKILPSDGATPVIITGVSSSSTQVTIAETPVMMSDDSGNPCKNPGNGYRQNERNENETKKKRESGLPRVIPSFDEVLSFWKAESLKGDPDRFFWYYETNGWMQGKSNPIRNWQMAARGWSCRETSYAKTTFARSRRIANVGAGVNFDPNRDISNAEF